MNSSIVIKLPVTYDYDPFGMLTPGRNWTAGSEYRYGFNGQEQDDEMYGNGNMNTAEFWEYDTRLGRRWNLDPKSIPNYSPYSVFLDNPIIYIDIKGDTTWLFQKNGIYIGQINDNLENQSHYYSGFRLILVMADYYNKNKKGQDYLNGLATDMRGKSSAFIGKNTIESLNKVPYIDKETGGILLISETRELIAIDKTAALAKLGYNSTSNSFPMSKIDETLDPKTEPVDKVFGTFHWHPGNSTEPTNYNDPQWKGWDRYGGPDDYYGYLRRSTENYSNSHIQSGGHMALLVTKDYIVGYQTMRIKFNTYSMEWEPNSEDEKSAAGVYKKFKKVSFSQ